MEGERYSYNAETLRRALAAFERAYKLDSEEFYAMYRGGGELPAELPRFDCHVWASFVEDVHRLEGSTPIERARQSFAHA